MSNIYLNSALDTFLKSNLTTEGDAKDEKN